MLTTQKQIRAAFWAEHDGRGVRFTYSKWRHGGWYVHGVRYPDGAVGCVSNNYQDKKWRIVCDPRPFESRPTFRTRGDAAAAEFELARGNG